MKNLFVAFLFLLPATTMADCVSALNENSGMAEIMNALKCQQYEINTLKNKIADSQESENSDENKSEKKEVSMKAMRITDFTVGMGECQRSGGSAVCPMVVRNDNKNKDIKFCLNAGGRAFDQEGNEYHIPEGTVADKKVCKTIVAGLKVSAQVVASKLRDSASHFSLVKLKTNQGSLEFRDISLSQ